MTAWVFAVGRMLGLGSVAGIRPSMTLAVIGIVSKLGWGVGLNPTFSFLGHWLAIIIFVVLALFESSFDKIAKLDRLQDRLTMPYRLVAGGVAGAATIPFGWQGVVVGAVVGAGAAWTSAYCQGPHAAQDGVQRRRPQSDQSVGGSRRPGRLGAHAHRVARGLRHRRVHRVRLLAGALAPQSQVPRHAAPAGVAGPARR